MHFNKTSFDQSFMVVEHFFPKRVLHFFLENNGQTCQITNDFIGNRWKIHNVGIFNNKKKLEF